ncbi:RNA-binding domain-containing protein [Calocera cornea HHB12733]|uniref:RNA-binding domain-containing protein n=1 Tax=Calocera cornea HHB12733 TaxID=1353952 RepID=A0A165CU32_9BASI|nr:RNA-binding domain-containing protein [Calocera cornea HHB12733]
MFVGGLNWDTTDESLRRYFEQFGEVDACTIMRDAGGRSRGFAFLTFRDPAAVNAVMVREHHLDGKTIDPKRAIPRLEHQKTQKLFIGGLAPSVTSESMREFFSQFGTVIDSTVMVDRESGRSKGFGFVTFEDGQGAETLVGQGILSIDGKPIEVKLAQPRGAIKKENDGGSNRYGGQQQGGFNQRGAPSMSSGQPAPTSNVGSTFDPQAMAQLWQKMMMQQQMGGMGMGGMGGMPGMGMGMNPMGMGNMGMMGGNMGMMGGMGRMGGMPGMGMQGMGMGGMGMGRGAGGPGMGMGGPMGAPQGQAGIQSPPQSIAGGTGHSQSQSPPANPSGQKLPGGPVPNAPRGPAAMRAGGPPGGPGGVGPMRQGNRGQHNYHPYGR